MTEQNARILIVDDEELIVLAMRKYFAGLGYAVDSAYELEEAQALLGQLQIRPRHRRPPPHRHRRRGGAADRRRRPPAVREHAGDPAQRLRHAGDRARVVPARRRRVPPQTEGDDGDRARGREPPRQALIGTLGARPPPRSPGGITSVYQPIYLVSDGAPDLYGFECLSRGPQGTNFESPDVLFDYVRLKRQEIARRPRLHRRGAAQSARTSPARLATRINVHASTLGRDPASREFLAATRRRHAHRAVARDGGDRRARPAVGRRVVPAPRSASLRQLGASIALDDVGLGQSNFKMLLDASPTILKLDRYFVDGCTRDPQAPRRDRLVEELARRFGARVIAEGVETERICSRCAPSACHWCRGSCSPSRCRRRAHGALRS